MTTGPSVLFVSDPLHHGGAQRQLLNLTSGLSSRGWQIQLAVTRDLGIFDIAGLPPAISVIDLGLRQGVGPVKALRRLDALVRSLRPDIVHGYLDLPNLLTALLPRRQATKKVIGIRASGAPPGTYGLKPLAVSAVLTQVSQRVDLAIANSRAGLTELQRRRYRTRRSMLIPNGIDTDRFRPRPEVARLIRAELRIPPRFRVVGSVARFDPMKGLDTFVDAAAQLIRTRSDVVFVHVGGGDDELRRTVQAQANALGLGPRFRWLGMRDELPNLYPAMDILCLPSRFGEGFPNVLGEAMASGVPCVATNVGDAADIVGNEGEIVQAEDPRALAGAIGTMLARVGRDPIGLSRTVRARVLDEYSVERLVERTSEALLDLIRER